MFHQTFPEEISFLLKIKGHNLPQSKNFRNFQKSPHVRDLFHVCGGILNKLQGKVGTRSEKLQWQIVDCESILHRKNRAIWLRNPALK